MQSKYNNPIAGEVYGSLTLTGESFYRQTRGTRRLMVVAKCVCGDVRGYAMRYLITGSTKSCGCERLRKIKEIFETHGLSSHPLYGVYQDMKRRCYNPKCKAYPDYGGRGIIVSCEEWLNDIRTFYDWSIANGWSKGKTLDRKDNDGNYEPSNCRYVVRAIQNRNMRRNVLITAWGETKCATEWSRDVRCKVNPITLLSRLRIGRWSGEDALTILPNGNKKEVSQNICTAKMITAFGETKCISAWAEDKRCRIGYQGLKKRLSQGWASEDAISTPCLNNNKKRVIGSASLNQS